MAKLEGFTKVAVINICGKDYHFALYGDNISVGDKVLTSGTGGGCIREVKEIIPSEEAKERFKKNITAEIICKIDTSAYDRRVETRKRTELLKKEMDKKIKELEETEKYSMYAERFPELREMLSEYEMLSKGEG